MRKIVSDKELQAFLIEAGYRRAIGFTWEKCAEETLKVLEKTVKVPKSKHSGIKILKAGKKHINGHLIIKHQ